MLPVIFEVAVELVLHAQTRENNLQCPNSCGHELIIEINLKPCWVQIGHMLLCLYFHLAGKLMRKLRKVSGQKFIVAVFFDLQWQLRLYSINDQSYNGNHSWQFQNYANSRLIPCLAKLHLFHRYEHA